MRSLPYVWILALSASLTWADIHTSPGASNLGARRATSIYSTSPQARTSAYSSRHANPSTAGRYYQPQPRAGKFSPAPKDAIPRVVSRAEHRHSPGVYPMRYNITATVFWVGEDACARNPVHNHKSSWDVAWRENFGGFDDPNPDSRLKGPWDYRPKKFLPRQNPFYVALPYNDVTRGQHKDEAARVIPWFRRDFEGKGKSVCKGKWVQIFYKNKYCFAQWEDCGPFTTEDWKYVFGDSLPQNKNNKNAGIDISPAVRDYLGITGGTAQVSWRFVDFHRIPKGPWSKYGDNNPFVHPLLNPAVKAELARIEKLKAQRTAAEQKALASNPKTASNG